LVKQTRLVAPQDGSEVAPIAPGDEAIAFAQLGRNVGDLEALRFAGIDRTPRDSKPS
jgi:hypothetical protein